MTYLEIINKVLLRLRENTVAASNTNTYSKLIAEFVNQALYECEHSFDWTVLKETITITTAASDALYDFHTADTKILQAINDTEETFIRPITADFQHRQDYLVELTEDAPFYYSFEGKNGDYSQIKLTPTPDGVYSLKFLTIKYTPELLVDGTDDADEIKIPSLPVILKAYALAVSERGEDGGIGYNEATQHADRVLADAIALDATKNHFMELSWCAV